MGGDEFVLLIPAGWPDDLEAKVEAMRDVVRKAGAETPEPCILSLSLGVARFPMDGSGAEELLAEADRRMYKNKRMRRKERPAVVEIEGQSLEIRGSAPPVAAAS
jgi:diguanylate cyclase (GGDEF)-like protein